MPSTWLLTGGNRGIGLELARQLSGRGEPVIATARNPGSAPELRALGGVRVERVDLAVEASVEELAARLAGTPVDVVVLNAAIGDASAPAEKVPVAELERYFRTNSIGPIHLAQALLPNLRAGSRRLVVAITSGLGSLADNRGGGWMGYRASKTALHQLVRTLAAELSAEGFTFALISPGWVRTRMGGAGANLSPEESVRAILRVIDGLTREDNGRFFDHQSRELPW